MNAAKDSEKDSDYTACRRCGTCCKQGGPALHLEDLELIRDEVLAPIDLVAVRAGEPAHDPLSGRVVPTAHEFLKVAGTAGSWCCRFYDRARRTCTIHRLRPLECRLLFCRDTGPVEAVMGRGLLERSHILAPDDPVRELLHRQEKEISYSAVVELLADLDRGDEPDGLLARLNLLVRADIALRQLFLRLYPSRERHELFLLGRPLFLVLAPYGFRISENGSGVSLHFVQRGKESCRKASRNGSKIGISSG